MLCLFVVSVVIWGRTVAVAQTGAAHLGVENNPRPVFPRLMGMNIGGSLQTWAGWPKMMQRYPGVMANTRAPRLVGFKVHGKTNDFRFFRYAFASCLLDDGFFCFTDDARGYSSEPRFDELDFDLDAATAGRPTAAWTDGVWRRDFEHGSALVNSAKQPATVDVGPGFRRLAGGQDRTANKGQPVRSITLDPNGDIILRRP